MSRRTWLILTGAVLVVIVVSAITIFTSGDTSTTLPGFSKGKIIRGEIQAVVSATGTLSPVVTVQVGSQVSGVIKKLYADFNSIVKQGEVIAEIDPDLFKARLAEAEANFHSNQAALDKAMVDMQETLNNLNRVKGLFAKKLASEDEMDTANFAYESARAEQRIKQAAVAQAQAVVQREKVNLAYTSIYAPIDGVVISRDVDVGQTVAASLQAPTLFTIAQDLKKMQIETDVDEAFIGLIRENQPVDFTVFAYQARHFNGSVTQVRLQPKIETGVVKYNCIIHVDNSELLLKPGMTATVAIVVSRKKNVLKVANSALRFVPDWPAKRLKEVRQQLKENETYLWVPEGEDFHPLKVHIGIIGEYETEISGSNTNENMTIALPPKRKDSSQRRRFGLSLF